MAPQRPTTTTSPSPTRRTTLTPLGLLLLAGAAAPAAAPAKAKAKCPTAGATIEKSSQARIYVIGYISPAGAQPDLDSGDDVSDTSLAVVGKTITWTRGGVLKSAPFA